MHIGRATLLTLALAAAAFAATATLKALTQDPDATTSAQIPTWSPDDRQFFLHGSISTEFVPESVLKAFIATYPDLFPTADFSHLGATPDSTFGWPIGFSRAKPAHLAGLTSVGINCASCHVGQVSTDPADKQPITILGMTANFNSDAFFGSIIGATFRSMDPQSLHRLLAEYLDVSDPLPDPAARGKRRAAFNALWESQKDALNAAISSDATGAQNAGPGGLQDLQLQQLQLTAQMIADRANLAPLASATLKLFHNMRAALHVPDEPPKQLPPAPGPGRTDAFGTLSVGLFGIAQPFAPAKFGLVWNVSRRPWVHWDANTRSPLGRNILAAVGLGTPLIGHEAKLDFAAMQRHTALSEQIAAPHYPWPIDKAAAARGEHLYQANCASCHDGAQTDQHLFTAKDTGTDPLRAELFTQAYADRLNTFLAELKIPGYEPSKDPGIRSTQKYLATSLAGVWARSPYLHNGSIRTMAELLLSPNKRSATFHRGSNVFDPVALGYIDAGAFVWDTHVPGNSNAGHDYGTALSNPDKHDLIEFLKTR